MPLNKFTSFILFFASLLISCTSFSNTITASDLIDGKFNAKTKQNRLLIANDIQKNVKVLNSLIPDTSPMITKWLKVQRREIETLKDKQIRDNRITELVNTSDFQQDRLKNYFKNISEALTCIQNQPPISKEMYCWSYLGFLLTGQVILGDALTILSKEGKLPKTINPELVMEQYNWYGRGILQYIIIPYMGGDVH